MPDEKGKKMNSWIVKRLALMLAAGVVTGSATISSAQEPPAEAEAGPGQAAETDEQKQAREKAEELAEQRLLVAKIMDQWDAASARV